MEEKGTHEERARKARAQRASPELQWTTDSGTGATQEGGGEEGKEVEEVSRKATGKQNRRGWKFKSLPFLPVLSYLCVAQRIESMPQGADTT